MPKRMLIDSSHPEETRVVVLDGQKVDEFDFEAASKRPLKGNIYLAKVTRVEPSLQAAFVEYGGNRQGFLAFSEIHPDYYQIPVADRMALLADQQAEARRRQEDDVESFEIARPKQRASSPENSLSGSDEDEASDEEPASADAENGSNDDDGSEEVFSNRGADDDDEGQDDEDGNPDQGEFHGDRAQAEHAEAASFPEPHTETSDIAGAEVEQNVADEQTVAGAAAELDDPNGASAPIASPDPDITGSVPDIQTASESPAPAQALQAPRPPQRWMRKRHYKIQEVIKRRQIILVQVVKEERGNKGAALTTYLSLAGRYCVLMPNTPRGGGISRKITNANDRKRLKSAAQSLELPEGMGLIIRTAGENRTKVEIKRDYEYLLRMWDTIRELTLKSNAPSCVYEEGDLIKRAIRDLYNKDVSEVLVEGDGGYRNAKDFMRMLMPSHAKNVKPYKEPIPLFQRHHIEAQLDAMFSPTVTLKSGGYIVINQTEALVSIDVNSGRATREHSIEETAHKTNLEAADEIARQLRLRDLAGLIVIDFIDMEDSRNDRDVEKRIRDAVKNDRARVQIGKISQFGLLEMSRQRLRAGVIAGSTVPCPHCGGQGIVRSVESTSLRVLRGLEEEGQRMKASAVVVRVAADVAIYTLNQKRRELARIENDYGLEISFEPKEWLLAGTFDIERTTLKTPEERAKYAMTVEAAMALQPEIAEEPEPEIVESEIVEVDEDSTEAAEVAHAHQPAAPREPHAQEDGGRRRRRRRRRGGRDRERPFQDGPRDHQHQPAGGQRAQTQSAEPHAQSGDVVEEREGEIAGLPDAQAHAGEPMVNGDGPRRRRRRRRGRRGRGPDQFRPNDASAPQPEQFGNSAVDRFGEFDEIDTTPREEPRPVGVPNSSSAPLWSFGSESSAESTPAPVRESKPMAEAVSAPEEHEAVEQRSEPVTAEPVPATAAPAEPPGPPKKGWWQRTFRPAG